MNRIKHILFSFLFIFCAPAYAVDVTPPSPVPALSPTVITINCDPDSFVVILGVVDGSLYLPNVKDISPGVITFTGPPGTYAIMGQEKGKRFQQSIVIVGEKPKPKPDPDPGPDPDPNPDPEPDPDPDPYPPPGIRGVTIIYESELNTPQFVGAARYLQLYCLQKKHAFRLQDDDGKLPDGTTPAWLTQFLDLAKQRGVPEPFMVVTARSGGELKILATVPFPSSGTKAVELLKGYGG